MVKRSKRKSKAVAPVQNEPASAENESNAVVLVPNGTAATATKLEKLIAQGRHFFAQAAQSVMRFSETVRQAERELNATDFAQFCAAFGLDPYGSTLRKLKKIAEQASRFEPESILSKTPGNWTTMYALAKLEKPKFDQVVQDKRFGPTMTAAEVREIISDVPAQESERLSRDLILEMSGSDREKKRSFFQEIRPIVEKFGFKYEIGAGIVRELMPADTKAKLTFADILRSAGGR